MKTALQSGTKLIVVVLQELLKRASYDTYADLKNDLKSACARLHLPYDAGLITDALDRLEHGGRQSCLRRRPEAILAPIDPTISAADAHRIMQAIEHRYGQPVHAKAMPRGAPTALVNFWTCVACGEANQGNWLRCWSCGRDSGSHQVRA
jgi:hypothetical protein